jgi:hypothetical protein
MEVILKKYVLFSTVSLLFSFNISLQHLQAQSYEGLYMHIDYVFVPTGESENFQQRASSVLKPVQQARKDEGIITDWYIYKVSYPGTHHSNYNYVVITVGESISGFEDVAGSVSSRFNNRNQQRIIQEFRNAYTPIFSELWTIRNSVMKDDEARPSRYMVMNYMRVGQGYEFEYQMMEDETARPLHERRMQNDVMNGWELQEMILPGGLEYGYNFSTIDHYENLAHVEFGFTEELIRQTHPETDINAFFDNINRSRDLVKREVWELVDSL